jgi:hypothetical protein
MNNDGVTGQQQTVDTFTSLENEARARNDQLLGTIMRNIETARINLRDTQFSPDTALLHFYEASAISIRNGSADEAVGRPSAKERFSISASLLEVAKGVNPDNAGEADLLFRTAVVGFHSRHNLLVLEHREIAKRTEAGVDSSVAFGELVALRDGYNELLSDISALPNTLNDQGLQLRLSLMLTGVKIAAMCGVASCLADRARLGAKFRDPGEGQQMIAEASEAVQRARVELLKATNGIESGNRGKELNWRSLAHSIEGGLSRLIAHLEER